MITKVYSRDAISYDCGTGARMGGAYAKSGKSPDSFILQKKGIQAA